MSPSAVIACVAVAGLVAEGGLVAVQMRGYRRRHRERQARYAAMNAHLDWLRTATREELREAGY